MIRAIDIKNLRGIREGRLEGFTELVVLVGPNSSGKSTVLDALLLAGARNSKLSLERISNRRPDLANSHQWLIFRDKGREIAPAEIVIQTDFPPSRRVSVSHVGNVAGQPLEITSESVDGTQGNQVIPGVGAKRPVLPSPKQSPPPKDIPEINLIEPGDSKQSLPDLYTRVAERGLTEQAKSIVMELVPDIRGIEILTQQGRPVLYIVYEDGAEPVALAGDGVRILLQESLELAAYAGGVVLLEEPEVHMHPGAIRQSARAMLAAMTRGIQVILTTHSLELIDSLLSEVKTEDLDKLSFYRVQLREDKLKSYRLSGKEASLTRTQIADDLR